MASFTLTGNLVDVHQQKIYPAQIKVEDERIVSITPLAQSPDLPTNFILPGFIDAHVHIESSTLR